MSFPRGLVVIWKAREIALRCWEVVTRAYNTNAGRFSQVDPVSGGSANAYDYALQNPVTGYDLSGQWACTRTTQWSSRRRCWAYISESQVNQYLAAFTGLSVANGAASGQFKKIAEARLCAELPVCDIAFVASVAFGMYMGIVNHGRGEYFEVNEWRPVVGYISGFSWYGKPYWSAWDGWWIPTYFWLQGA